MSKIARATVIGLTALMSAPWLQAAGLPGFSLAAETSRISFYSRDNRKVDTARTEAYLARVEALLGCKLEGRAEYYRYGSPEEIAAGTGTYAQGLTFPKAGQIHSTEEFHAHEIVHLVAAQLGNPGLFFQEGLAVALGNEGKWRGQRVDKIAKARARSLSLSTLVSRFERLDPEMAYPLAGSFVGRLIAAHGAAKVAQFFKAAGSSPVNTEAAFARTFGESLDEAGAKWVASL